MEWLQGMLSKYPELAVYFAIGVGYWLGSIQILGFKLGGVTGEYADTDVAGIGPVVLTTEWQQFTIDLEGKDLSSISGGFCWATNLDVNPDGATFYLDDIRYE